MERTASLVGTLLLLSCLSVTAAAADLIWTPVSSGSGGLDINYEEMINGGGRFVAIGRDPAGKPAIAESQDGLTWTGVFTGATSDTLTGIAYGNGTYIAVGGTQSFLSSDGINWNAGPKFPSSVASDVAFGNGIFVVLTDCRSHCTALSSTDGQTWHTQTLPSDFASTKALGFDGTRFVSVAGVILSEADSNGLGPAPVYTSCDGTTWTNSANIDSGSNILLYRVVPVNGNLVVLGAEACVGQGLACADTPDTTVTYMGKDSSDLARVPLAFDSDIDIYGGFTDLVFAGGSYYAPSFDLPLVSSSDAIHWSVVGGIPTTFTPMTVATSTDRIVIAGENGEILAASVSGGGGSAPTSAACTALPSLGGGGSGSLGILPLIGLLGLVVARRRDLIYP
ncbi:MAG TPA: hypothetical protein VGH91_05235 [Gammaproteobacteria bacterium]|jgi:hypothetical protein